MYKITDSAERIIENIKDEFSIDYELNIDDEQDYYKIVEVRSNTIYLTVMINTHTDYDNSISLSNTKNTYSTIALVDYYGNKKTDISSNYINEIKQIIDKTNYKIEQYICFTKALQSHIENDYDACVIKIYFNNKNHLFLRNKNNILRIKPIISINNDKIFASVIPLFSSDHDPVMEINVCEGNILNIYEDLSFFL